MALNFPNSPTIGQTFTNIGGSSWIWDGTTWNLIQQITNSATELVYLPDGVGAVQTTAADKFKESISVKDFGAVGDGVADDTVAINAALAALSGTGEYLRMPVGTYNVSSTINIPTKTGMIGDRGAKIFALKSGFNNVTDPTDLYSSNTMVIDMSGGTVSPFTANDDQKLIGMVIEFETFDGTVVNAVTARNCSNVEIDRNEIKNFNTSTGISLQSLTKGGRITNNYIHDFSNTKDYGGSYTVGDINLFGIEVDDDRINDVISSHVLIEGNHIENIAHTGAALTAYTDQSDAIGIQKGTYIKVLGNTLVDVNEAIDLYGEYCIVSNNVCKDNLGFGIKLIHGARFNTVSNNQVTNAGYGGIVVSGGAATLPNTEYNLFSDNVIIGIDPNNDIVGTTGCIQVDDQGNGTANNNSFVNNILDAGTYGQYNIVVQQAGSINNRFLGNTIITEGTIARYSLDHKTQELQEAIPTMVSVYRATDQTGVVTGTITKVQFDTEIVDRRAEYDNATNYRWTCVVPGFYQVTGGVRMAAFTTPNIYLYKNDSLERTIAASSTGDDSVFITYIVNCDAGDYLDIRVRHSAGVDRTITGGKDWAFMTIGQI